MLLSLLLFVIIIITCSAVEPVEDDKDMVYEEGEEDGEIIDLEGQTMEEELQVLLQQNAELDEPDQTDAKLAMTMHADEEEQQIVLRR